MPDLFSTDHLTGVVNALPRVESQLAMTFFPGTQTETSEDIHFDVEEETMGLAPFVSPLVEGRAMTEQGFTTKTFRPAYIKPKNTVSPGRAIKRYKGEPIGGNISPEQRMQLIVADILNTQRKLIDNRLEWMASSILRTGKVTISGENYPSVEVDFGRHSDLTVTAGIGAKWSDAINPLDDLQTWNDLMILRGGGAASNIVMDGGAWKHFRSNTHVKDRLNLQRQLGQMPTMQQAAIQQIGLTYMGMVDAFNIWTYSGHYKADNGTVTPILPNGTVLMVGALLGYQAYGAIQDERAGIQAVPVFAKSWLQEDPGLRFIMSQSAPLLVPYRPNATLCASVL